MFTFHNLVKLSHTLLVAPLLLYVGCKGWKNQKVHKNLYVLLMILAAVALIHHSGIFNFSKLIEQFYFEEKVRSKKSNNWFTGPKTHVIEIVDFEYRPQFINVLKGDTVKWVNRDPQMHTVTSYEDLFDSKEIEQEDEYSFTFKAAGVYNYFCKPHPYMKGSVTVVNASNRHQGHEEDTEWNPYTHPQNRKHLAGKVIG